MTETSVRRRLRTPGRMKLVLARSLIGTSRSTRSRSAVSWACVMWLEGSVQRSDNQVHVNAQLIDAEIDAHLWAERFDSDMGDLFALQNEITSRIANALGVELIAAEAARPTEHPDALDYILRGRAAGFKPVSRDSYAERISLFEHALALDPRTPEAQSLLAIALVARALDGMTDSAAADIARAQGFVDQALAASPRNAYAHLVKGPGAASAEPMGGGRSRIRDSARVGSQYGGRLTLSWLVQALHRVDRGGDPARGASHPSQPTRSRYRLLVRFDRDRASAAIAHRRGNRLARKRAQRPA